MVTGQNPAEAVYMLKDYIVHTHAKDGVRYNVNQDATEVYHAFATGGVEALNVCKGFKEVPLGQGQVNWNEYLSALKDIGYDGFLTIERECGDDPKADIVLAKNFLEEKLSKL
jgi:sugar phosphate isomerase/epimerase